MRLIYAHVGNFRNLKDVELHFDGKWHCEFSDNELSFRLNERDAVKDAIFGQSILRNLTIVVGETGAGKTNLFQLIGMDYYRRSDLKRQDSYIFVFEDEKEPTFIIEVCNLHPIGFDLEISDIDREYGLCALYSLSVDSSGNIIASRRLHRDFDHRCYIVNCFDRNAFSSPPCPDQHQEGMTSTDYFPRIVSPYGRTNIGMACEVLADYINRLPDTNIKRKAYLKINAFNWSDSINIEIPEDEEKDLYWTYRQKRWDSGILKRKKQKHSRKTRFLHDLLADYALYLRKWADSLILKSDADRFIDLLTGDGSIQELLKRIERLGSFIDLSIEASFPHGHGLVWQIADDIKDIYNILNSFDDQYFSDESFSLPIVDMDFSSRKVIDLFERMMSYRPDEYGIFTKCLLPYEIIGISSGEYQYAKALGAIDEFCLNLKISTQGNLSKAVKPDFILLLDEPDAFMHPELCRQFLYVTDRILTRHSGESNIQIIMSTHSPFMLSDVLPSQVIRLKQDVDGYCRVLPQSDAPTFAADIHAIMANDFFLDFTIGEFSRNILSGLLTDLRSIAERINRKDLGDSKKTDSEISDGNTHDLKSTTADEKAIVERAATIAPSIGNRLLRSYFESLIAILK